MYEYRYSAFDAIAALAQSVPPEAARPLADLLTAMATKLRDVADRHDREKISVDTPTEHQRRHRDVLVAVEIERGATLAEAITRLEHDGICADDVRAMWNWLKPRVARKQRQRRNTAIWRLYRAGATNDEIAGRTGLSSRQVGRIIRQRLTRSRDTR